MRVVEVRLHPEGGVFHPIEAAFVASGSLERRAIHQFAVHDDDTVVMLYELKGDVDAARAVLEAHPEVLSFDATASGSRVLAYVHFRSHGLAARLLRLVNAHNILLDLPIRYEPGRDGGVALRVRAVADVTQMMRAAARMPADLRVEFVRAGDRVTPHEDLYEDLTERQQRVLQAAVGVGYFDVPRRGTLEDVARATGLAVPTVGEHLRKAYSHVFKRLVPPP